MCVSWAVALTSSPSVFVFVFSGEASEKINARAAVLSNGQTQCTSSDGPLVLAITTPSIDSL